MASTRRFECVDGKSSKFWQIALDGASFSVTFGRIGTRGQTQSKTFATDAAAQAEHDKLVREKLGKGYKETAAVQTQPPAVAIPSTPAVQPNRNATVAVAPPSVQPTLAQPMEIKQAHTPAATRWDDTPRVVWTPGARRRLQPHRPSAPVVFEGSHADVLRQAWECWSAPIQAGVSRAPREHRRVMEAIVASAGSAVLTTDDAEVEAARAAVFALESRIVRSAGGGNIITPTATYTWAEGPDEMVVDALLDLWMASGGLAFATEVVARATDLEAVEDAGTRWVEDRLWPQTYGSSVAPLTPLWSGLRRRACAASDAAFDEACARAGKIRNACKGAVRCALAYALPGCRDWIAEDVRDLTANRLDSQGRAAWLLASVDDAATASQLADVLAASVSYGAAVFAFDLVERLGPAAAPVLAKLIPRWSTDQRRTYFEALALIDSDDAFAALASDLDKKEAQVAAADAFARSPRRALPVLAHTAGQGVTHAEALLRQLALANPAAVDVVLPFLPDRDRQVLESVRGVMRAADVPEATPGELPRVLAAPPWLSKTRRSALRTVSGLVPMTFQERLEWAPGERDRWAARRRRLWEEGKGWTPEQDDHLFALESKRGEHHISSLFLLTTGRALELWNRVLPKDWLYVRSEDVQGLVARFELDALPALLAMAAHDLPLTIESLTPLCSPRVAPFITDAFVRLKTGRAAAQAWLDRFPREAAMSLIPLAVGDGANPRNAASETLRYVAAKGHDAIVRAVAADYGKDALDAVSDVLAFDPLMRFPARLPKMPAFWTPAIFPRPLLRDRSKCLSLPAVEALGTMLAISTLDDPYAGLAQVRDACDRASLGEFAWALFSAWETAGAPSKDAWAYHALGHIGDDETARRLTPVVRQMPSAGQMARATQGLDMLACIGSDTALMHLHGIAQKVKSRPLQERAAAKMQQVAEARGLTSEELADLLVPDLGLDPDGSRVLDFGTRTFRVGFDEHLRPFVKDADGARLKELPKPGRSDDPDKSAAASALWKTLKADARKVATSQIIRLEMAMCRRRRWSEAQFRPLLVDHPLVGHLVRRLVWGVYDGDSLVGMFRVAEDRSFADVEDHEYTLPPNLRIGIPHRLEVTQAQVEAWSRLFGDYEILQPFAQLGRAVHVRTQEEKTLRALGQVDGLQIDTGKVLSLETRGWRRGRVGDGGTVYDIQKPLPIEGYEAVLPMDPGIFAGGTMVEGTQKLGPVVFQQRGTWDEQSRLTVGELDEVTYSELVTDLLSLRG